MLCRVDVVVVVVAVADVLDIFTFSLFLVFISFYSLVIATLHVTVASIVSRCMFMNKFNRLLAMKGEIIYIPVSILLSFCTFSFENHYQKIFI